MESQQFISSLHKIYGIRTRVPKKFRPNRKKKSERQEDEGRDQLGGVPFEITVSSTDQRNKDKNSLRDKTPQLKKPGKRRGSVIASAKAGIDMNMFSVDDSTISGGLEGLEELAINDSENVGGVDFESAGKYDPPSDTKININSNNNDNAESLLDTQPQDNLNVKPMEIEPFKQKMEQRQRQRQQQQEQKQHQKKIQQQQQQEELKIVHQSSSESHRSSKIGRQFSGGQGSIGRQSSNASQDGHQISRQISRQRSSFSWMGSMSNISRQSSWFSRQDSQADADEPDEETPEEKAARVAALRYYPIGFHINQCVTIYCLRYLNFHILLKIIYNCIINTNGVVCC